LTAEEQAFGSDEPERKMRLSVTAGTKPNRSAGGAVVQYLIWKTQLGCRDAEAAEKSNELPRGQTKERFARNDQPKKKGTAVFTVPND
jgi:hypothetical protein